jgi:tungstate transport system substrate-binding protein
MRVIRLALVLLCAQLAAEAQQPDPASLILATTTSTQDSGLLDVLVPQFEAASRVRVKVIAVGTGAALRMASGGNADAVLVHAPEAEQPLIKAGDLIEGVFVMHNDYVLVGPAADPAGARRAASTVEAMQRIAATGAFISRGDNSGTHTQELALWRAAGIAPASIARREETGQGMGATLTVANQRRAYTLTDRGTYLALRHRLELAIVHQGDQRLRNLYHAYVVNPSKHRGVNATGARAFLRFLVSPATQRTIGTFRRQELGEALFIPAAPQP